MTWARRCCCFSAGEEGGSTGDVERDSRTVFLSNLDFGMSADRLRQHWQATGQVADLRVVKDYKGRSKGFAYLEFTSIVSWLAGRRERCGGWWWRGVTVAGVSADVTRGDQSGVNITRCRRYQERWPLVSLAGRS